MALTAEQKTTILKEIVQGKNGRVDQENCSVSLDEFVGERLDVRIDFDVIVGDGEVTQEDMSCGKLISGTDITTGEAFYQVDRISLPQLTGDEVDSEGNNLLATLEAQEKITL